MTGPIRRYLRRVWLALNQLGNTLAGGQPDETVSARSGRVGGPVCDVFEALGDEDHCEVAIENERRGKSQDAAYRPEAFVTRRAALQLVALAPFVELETRTLDLNAPIVVARAGRTLTIDPDAMWHALEAAIRMPLNTK